MKYYFLLFLLFLICKACPLDAQSPLWARQIGGIFTDDANSIAIDGEGYVYTAGNFSSRVDFDPGPDSLMIEAVGLMDVYITKHDKNGNLIWVDRIGGTSFDHTYSLALDQAGNIYCGGFFSDTADFDPGGDVFNLSTDSLNVGFVAKYNNDGHFIWAKAIGQRTDNTKRNFVNRVLPDDAENVFVLGAFSGTADVDPGPGDHFLTAHGTRDMFYLKLDALGSLLWVQQIGGEDAVQGLDINLDAAQNIFITGSFDGFADFDPGPGVQNIIPVDYTDAYVMKTNPSGELIWVKPLPGNDIGWVNDLEFDRQGNLLFTGFYNGDTDFDPGPASKTLVNGGDEDGFVCKWDPDGNYIWAIRMTGEGFQEGTDIVIHENGPEDEIYVTGFYLGDFLLDQQGDALDLQSVNSSVDVFLLKMDMDSVVEHTASIGGPNTDLGYGLRVGNNEANEGIYVAGYFKNTADFDPGEGDFNLTSAGNADAFLVKYADFTTGTFSPTYANEDILVYPNPAREELNIEVPGQSINAYSVFDSQARKMLFRKTTGDSKIMINVHTWPNGIYYVQLLSDHHSFFAKVIVNSLVK